MRPKLLFRKFLPLLALVAAACQGAPQQETAPATPEATATPSAQTDQVGAVALTPGDTASQTPTVDGTADDEARAAPAPVDRAPEAIRPAAPPTLGRTRYAPEPLTPFEASKTPAGQRISRLRGELAALHGRLWERDRTLQLVRRKATANIAQYHSSAMMIADAVAAPTRPDNPVLIVNWNQVEAELDFVNNDIIALNNLVNELAADSGMATFLLRSIRREFNAADASSEDRRQLAVLEDEGKRTAGLTERFLASTREDLMRIASYVANERRYLMTLALTVNDGELYGASLVHQGLAPVVASRSLTPAVVAEGRRPLVIVRFAEGEPRYEEALFGAISQAIQRKPNATFDLIAVAPDRGTAAEVARAQTTAREDAEKVLATISEMGMPLSRVNFSVTTSGLAKGSEVHLYVR